MNFWDKLTIVRQEYKRLGAKEREIAPPPFKLAWLMRIPVRPPITASFLANVLVIAVFFDVFFVAIMAGLMLLTKGDWDWGWLGRSWPVWVGVGPFVGVFSAVQFMRLRIKRKFPTWQELELDGKFDQTVDPPADGRYES